MLLIKQNMLISTTSRKLSNQQPESSVAKPLSTTRGTFTLNYAKSVAPDLVSYIQNLLNRGLLNLGLSVYV